MTVDMSTYIEALTGAITIGDIITVLASVVGVGMTFFLGWLGVRKATRTFTTAVSKGNIKI